MNDSWNLDKLSDDALILVLRVFKTHWVGWTLCYAIEIRLDDPIKNILDGGDGLVTHGGNGSRHYLKHYNDPDWAVIHCEDPSWLYLIESGK